MLINCLRKNWLIFVVFFFLDSNFTNCVNLAWTKGWYVELLNSKNTSFVHSAIEVVTYEDVKWDQLGGCSE
jgi:hypothetical protein